MLFENDAFRKRHKTYYLATVKIKDYNVKNDIDGRNLFDKSINDDIKTYQNINATGQGDCCTIGFHDLKENYEMTEIDLIARASS